MKLKVISISEQRPSTYGGEFFYIFFKDIESGKNYKSCIASNCRNLHNWDEVSNKFKDGLDVYVDNVKVKGDLVDADSKPVVIINNKGGDVC